MSENSNKKTIGDHLRQVGAFSILLGFFGAGLAVAGGFWSSTVSSLNVQLTQSRGELNKATQELAQVKADYYSYKTSSALVVQKNVVQKNNDKLPIAKQASVTKPALKDVVLPRVETHRINNGDSFQFFDGELTVSLVTTSFEGDPLRYKVIANASSDDGKSVKINKQDIGFTASIKGKRNYTISVLEAETFSAIFKVVRQ